LVASRETVRDKLLVAVVNTFIFGALLEIFGYWLRHTPRVIQAGGCRAGRLTGRPPPRSVVAARAASACPLCLSSSPHCASQPSGVARSINWDGV